MLWWAPGYTAQAERRRLHPYGTPGLPDIMLGALLGTSQMPASVSAYLVIISMLFPRTDHCRFTVLWVSELDRTEEFILSRIVVSGLNFASELLLRTLIYKMDKISCAAGGALPTGQRLSLP